MNTVPCVLKKGKLCSSIRVRFLSDKRQDIVFSGTEVTGSKFLHVTVFDGVWILHYVSDGGTVIKTIYLNGSELLEIMLEGGLCRMVVEDEEEDEYERI